MQDVCLSFDVTPEISEETNYAIEKNPRKPPPGADVVDGVCVGGFSRSAAAAHVAAAVVLLALYGGWFSALTARAGSPF